MVEQSPQHQDSELRIRREIERNWRRRILLLMNMILYSIGFFFILTGGYRSFDPNANVTVVLFLLWSTLLILHFGYVLTMELRERAIKREIRRERRWRILEQIQHMPAEQRPLARLILEDDGELPDEDSFWDEKPKRELSQR